MTTTTIRQRHTSHRAFLLHFIEMLVVMFIGMGVFSAITALLFAGAGTSLGSQPGWLRIMLMGVNMTIPMVLWMAWRGHAAARNVEMAASMLLPSTLAAALVGASWLDTMSGMLVQHVVMVPAMLAVMLWRYAEYAHSHGTAAH